MLEWKCFLIIRAGSKGEIRYKTKYLSQLWDSNLLDKMEVGEISSHFSVLNFRSTKIQPFWVLKAQFSSHMWASWECLQTHGWPLREIWGYTACLTFCTSPDREGMRWPLLWSTILCQGNKPPLITSISSSNHEALWPPSQIATSWSPRHQLCLSVDTISSVWRLANANAGGIDNRFLRDISWLI